MDNAAAVITEHVEDVSVGLGHGSQPVSKHERVIDSSVKSGHRERPEELSYFNRSKR